MKGVIVVIPDIFGWVLPNTRLLADGFARKTGLTVYVPDFMSGQYSFFFPMKRVPLGAYSVAILRFSYSLASMWDLKFDKSCMLISLFVLGDSFPIEHLQILLPDTGTLPPSLMAKA